MLLQAAESLFFGNTGIRHAVHVALQQVPFVLRGEIAVVGHALVVRMGDEVHNILFEVRTGAGDDLHLVPANHLRQ